MDLLPPTALKDLGNWLSGQRSRGTVTFCPTGSAAAAAAAAAAYDDDDDCSSDVALPPVRPVTLGKDASACDANHVEWSGKTSREDGLPKGQGHLQRRQTSLDEMRREKIKKGEKVTPKM